MTTLNLSIALIFILFIVLMWRGPKRGIPKYKNTPASPEKENRIVDRVKTKRDYFQSIGYSEWEAVERAIENTAKEFGMPQGKVVAEILK